MTGPTPSASDPSRLELSSKHAWLPLCGAAIIAAFLLGMYSTVAAIAEAPVRLTGDDEVPPIRSEGTGTGTVAVARDRSVTATVSTTGILGTEAHIHEGARGSNGPAIIALTRSGDAFVAPRDARLSEEQLANFMAGNLYINVHTAANPLGEIRGQVTPR